MSYLSHVECIQGRVFVHCLAGVSRSVSVVLLYLVLRHRIPLRHAFRYVRACRPQINPNNAFKLQLAKLEVQELRYSSVAKDADRVWDFYEWNRLGGAYSVMLFYRLCQQLTHPAHVAAASGDRCQPSRPRTTTGAWPGLLLTAPAAPTACRIPNAALSPSSWSKP